MALARALGARCDELNAEHQDLVRGRSSAARRRGRPHGGRRRLRRLPRTPSRLRSGRRNPAALNAHAWPDGHPFRVRIGLHTGRPTGRRRLRRLRGQPGGADRRRRPGRPDRPLRPDAGPDRRRPAAAGASATWAPPAQGPARPERLFQLEVAGLPTDFPPLRGGGSAPTGCPQRLTAFVGREDELEALASCSASRGWSR